MIKKRLGLVVLLAMIILISTSCTPSVAELQPAVDEYKASLKQIYSELDSQYAKNPTKEEWATFSKDWMPKLTSSTPEKLNGKMPKEITGEVSQLDNVKGKLMYLWTEYDNKMAGKKYSEDNIKQLKENIENNLK
ncbi:MAG: hypothetical protein N4A68_18140 [Maledivibacter sp.]|jgi:hypothetical protein|nr:hypothetical protein [Maledivibacter sp.]